MQQLNPTSERIPLVSIPSLVTNYGSEIRAGLASLMLEIANKPHIFLDAFIEFIIIKLNDSAPQPSNENKIRELKRLQSKIVYSRPGNSYFWSDLYLKMKNHNTCIETFKIVMAADIFEASEKLNAEQLDESLHHFRLENIEYPLREVHKAPKWSTLKLIHLLFSLILFTSMIIPAYMLNYYKASKLKSLQCFPCNNTPPCFTKVNKNYAASYIPLGTNFQMLFIMDVLSFNGGLAIIINSMPYLYYSYELIFPLYSLKRLRENKSHFTNRVAANIASLIHKFFCAIAAPMAAYMFYRASKFVHSSAGSFMQFITCFAPNSTPALATCSSFPNAYACNLTLHASQQYYNKQLKEGVVDFGIGALFATFSVYALSLFIKFLINSIKDYLNHHSALTSKAHVSFFASPDDNECVPRNRSGSINDEGSDSIRLIEMSPNQSTKVTADEINQMTRAMRTYRAPAST